MTAAPFQLLHFNNKTPQLHREEFKRFLLKVGKRKFVVISIGGPYRKGKGYFLNFFIKFLSWLENGKQGEWLNPDDKLNAFSWKSGYKGDTQGIFMWNEPFILKSRGEEVAVLLMDTQGTYDTNKTTNEAASIFALSTLASSVQIYNLSQLINEIDLEYLSLFVKMAQHVDRKKGNNLQKLQFLIRDWVPVDEIGYGSDEGEKYLNDILNEDSKDQELMEVRKHLKSSFKETKCTLLPFPGVNVRVNNNIDKTIRDMEIDPLFIEHLEHVFFSLTDNLLLKTMNETPMTPTGFFNLIEEYTTVFESGELPEPVSLLDATTKIINRNALDMAQDQYDQEVKDFAVKNPNATNEQFMQQHNLSKVTAKKTLIEQQFNINNENLTVLEIFFKQRLAEKNQEFAIKEAKKKATKLKEDLKLVKKN